MSPKKAVTMIKKGDIDKMKRYIAYLACNNELAEFDTIEEAEKFLKDSNIQGGEEIPFEAEDCWVAEVKRTSHLKPFQDYENICKATDEKEYDLVFRPHNEELEKENEKLKVALRKAAEEVRVKDTFNCLRYDKGRDYKGLKSIKEWEEYFLKRVEKELEDESKPIPPHVRKKMDEDRKKSQEDMDNSVTAVDKCHEAFRKLEKVTDSVNKKREVLKAVMEMGNEE
jgi:hypothetical protein